MTSNELICILTALLITPVGGRAESVELTPDTSPMVEIDFERPTPAARELLEHRHIDFAGGDGVHGGNALRVKYVPYERGSERVVKNLDLPTVDEATLGFSVKFGENFDFAKGGKLHGLGPVHKVTGGRDLRPDGWSARAVFVKDGGLRSYNYFQDQDGKYGDLGRVVKPAFHFERGRWHRVNVHVKINTAPNIADGFTRLYVDGRLVEHMEDLRFRGELGEDTRISRLLFSTFHGGSNPDWSPKNADGEPITVYAWFDDIRVFPGEVIEPAVVTE